MRIASLPIAIMPWLSSPKQMSPAAFDWSLLLLPMALVSIGVVMVASASLDFAAFKYGDPWFFTRRYLLFLTLGCAIGAIIFLIPIEIWNRYSIVLLALGFALLCVVLIPGIGKSVNGAQRWISLGGFTLQASELAKFTFVIFFASFLSRRTEEFQTSWSAFFNLIIVLGAFITLLLIEPDFGSAVVLCITAGAMMFVAGVPIIRFILLALVAVIGLALMAVMTPYRWERLVTYLDPWEKQFSSGYQLVQSLIAFGRGEWVGLGLGNSLQKLFFLPEAHTDFIFAIVAEEFGLVGATAVVVLFAWLVVRILKLASVAKAQGRLFVVFALIGVATLLASQAFINMGVSSGLLPTKGLTLPFISYGGSSLIVNCAFVALILRMNWEVHSK